MLPDGWCTARTCPTVGQVLACSLLIRHLDRSFDERRENFRQLFERLDGAIQGNNAQMAAAVLDSVIKLADASPFKALKDVASTREALGQKGKEWQFQANRIRS
ncbi:hypothetical protein G4177_03400 [Corallococcus sp. ZKHCc1 1396]|uniref:Uncharacterized protein n=2 Tax=Corallococcus soli TaxID=2710757 RepID=A0ABR9PH45_9BACT|nr:hypothetical protein [Corallococcus soli]